MQSLLQDLRYGFRILAKSPAFSVIAVITLALGIGANTAIFSVINAVLLRPLAIHEPSGVAYVQEQWRELPAGLSVGNFSEVRSGASSLENVSASNPLSFNLATSAAPERVLGEVVTANYFDTFAVAPKIGRAFITGGPQDPEGEDQPGDARVVIISERLWRTHFHADSAILGQTLQINSSSYTVVGVMPKSFDPLLNKTEIWIPAAFTSAQLADYDNHYLSVMARLKPGATLAQAQSELNVIAFRLQQQHPIDDKERGLRIASLATSLLGDQRSVLRMMLAAVGLVLLIACANIANLQLARARGRQKEMAMRAALGASRRRIVQQLLAENVVLGLGGGLVGIFLAYWSVAWIVAKGPTDVPRLEQSTVDPRVLIFALAVSFLASFLFGLAPALRSAGNHLSGFVAQSAGTVSSGVKDRVRSALVIGEIALALMLMAGAGLLFRSALLVSHLSAGFDTTNLVIGRVGLPQAAYQDPALTLHTFERIADAAARLPGVESAAVVSRAPMGEGWTSNGLLAEGRPLDPTSLVDAQIQIVSPSYLHTVHVPLKAGRNFTAQDLRSTTLVTIINETLARAMWPNENPIGKRFACCEAGAQGRMDPVWHQVVGLAGDVRAQGLDQRVKPTFYIPMEQMPAEAWIWLDRTMDVVLRTHNAPFPANDLRAAVASIAPGVAVYDLSTMQEKIAGTLATSHFDTFLLGLFAVIALLLSSVGIYRVLSYIVAQRTRDIGIRMALGATQAAILNDILSYGLRLAAIGLALGLAGALAGTRLLSSFLYGVHPSDPVTLLVVCLVFASFALLASYLPARRAMRLEPMVALRYE